MRLIALFILIPFIFSACKLGPDYKRPYAPIPCQYKEMPKGWKRAEPQDCCDKGPWWEVFNDPNLNALEAKLNISNETINAAVAQYFQSQALVEEARSALFPLITGSISAQRQGIASTGNVTQSGSASSPGNVNTGGSINGNVFNTYFTSLNASWTLDIWGSVRRMVEANVAASQASAAQVMAIRLSSQATLAEDYFNLRTLDVDQRILDNTVIADANTLRLTKKMFKAGTASLANIVQAQAALETAKAAAMDNGIARAQLEHAIAVLIGEPASCFAIRPNPCYDVCVPSIPCQIPSQLLERRPDIAQSERLVAQANANIGVAIAAFFPAVTLLGDAGYITNQFHHWFSLSHLFWAMGVQAAETIFDGGLRIAQTKAAKAVYLQTAANYRQTVLAAFQNVEDNFASLRILEREVKVQRVAMEDAKVALKLVLNEYKAGTASYLDIYTAQINADIAEKAYADTVGRELVAAVSLITALGGGWDACTLPRD